ncbi:hypothetical protein ACFPRL_16380 [Pseudoclavibacter helvolus]
MKCCSGSTRVQRLVSGSPQCVPRETSCEACVVRTDFHFVSRETRSQFEIRAP